MESLELIKNIKNNDLQKIFFHLNEKKEYLSKKFTTAEEGEEKLKELGFGEMEQKSSVCNSDEMNVVIHFKDHNIYLMLTGEYDSYGEYNHDYDNGIKEVFPKTQTLTVYE